MSYIGRIMREIASVMNKKDQAESIMRIFVPVYNVEQ